MAVGFLVYALVAGLGGGVDFEDRVTLDQSGELELEGIALFYGVVFGAVGGAPLGTFIVLRLAAADRAGKTAALTLVFAPMITVIASRLVPAAPDDPILLPYFLFGGWFLAGAVARALVTRVGPRTITP